MNLISQKASHLRDIFLEASKVSQNICNEYKEAMIKRYKTENFEALLISDYRHFMKQQKDILFTSSQGYLNFETKEKLGLFLNGVEKIFSTNVLCSWVEEKNISNKWVDWELEINNQNIKVKEVKENWDCDPNYCDEEKEEKSKIREEARKINEMISEIIEKNKTSDFEEPEMGSKSVTEVKVEEKRKLAPVSRELQKNLTDTSSSDEETSSSNEEKTNKQKMVRSPQKTSATLLTFTKVKNPKSSKRTLTDSSSSSSDEKTQKVISFHQEPPKKKVKKDKPKPSTSSYEVKPKEETRSDYPPEISSHKKKKSTKKMSRNTDSESEEKTKKEKCTENNQKVGFHIDSEDNNIEEFLSYLDSRTREEFKSTVDLIRENITQIHNSFAVLMSFSLLFKKIIKKVPFEVDEKTGNIVLKCKGCMLHCTKNWPSKGIPGRPSKDSIKRKK